VRIVFQKSDYEIRHAGQKSKSWRLPGTFEQLSFNLVPVELVAGNVRQVANVTCPQLSFT
jgi:hypothetical protein